MNLCEISNYLPVIVPFIVLFSIAFIGYRTFKIITNPETGIKKSFKSQTGKEKLSKTQNVEAEERISVLNDKVNSLQKQMYDLKNLNIKDNSLKVKLVSMNNDFLIMKKLIFFENVTDLDELLTKNVPPEEQTGEGSPISKQE